jgi:hypothetical protein
VNAAERAKLAPVQPDRPVAGFYKGRMVRNGPWVPIRIWHGPTRDPETGEELDRSWHWQAERLGVEIDVFIVWPYCAGHRIEQAEYDYLLADHRWAVANNPDDPAARPRDAIDHHAMKPVF